MKKVTIGILVFVLLVLSGAALGTLSWYLYEILHMIFAILAAG